MTTTDQQAVTVAQEDREAAAKLFGFPAWENVAYIEDRAASERIRSAVQAFARHRLASVSSASAETADHVPDAGKMVPEPAPATNQAGEVERQAPYMWRLDRSESESLFAALHGLTCSRDIADIPDVMEAVTDIFRSTVGGDATRSRDLAEFATLAQSINDSPALMSIYAAPEWDELDDNGQQWVSALVRETMARCRQDYAASIATQPATSQEGKRFTSWSTDTLADQCRMQARDQLDPELSSFLAEVADRLAATPTPPTLSEDLREAIEGVIEHVEVRIQDGKEIGSTVWRLALEDVARDLRAALVKQRAAPKPAPVTIPPARSYADEDVARMIDPWAWDEAERYRVRADHWFAKGRTEPGDCLTDGYRARADAMQAPLLAKAAAIRLLSQGEKA